MTLEIILPPAPRACDRNHGKAGIAAAGANKRARLIAKLRTLEAMRKQGVDRGAFKPKYMCLTFLDATGRLDADNAVATFKHYQDGIFDALGVDDRNVADMYVRKRKLRHEGRLVMGRWTRCFLTDEYYEFEDDYRSAGAGVAAMFKVWVNEAEKGDAR